MTFRQLQDKCEQVSPTVLNKRLKELRASGLVEHNDAGYQLSPNGLELFKMLKPFGSWSTKWAADLAESRPNGEANGSLFSRVTVSKRPR